jgi:uncharacterized membrane protein
MNPVVAIGVWAVLFVGTHLFISSSIIRPWLVDRLGEQAFRGVYSLVAFAMLIPLVVIFAHHKHAGPMLWYWRGTGPIRWLAWLMMLVALIFLIAGLVNPNPAAIGAPAERPIGGILKITRHPSFIAFTLFGLAHMLMNGWVGDLLFFGSFSALGILGGLHQDWRKLHEIGEPYRRFVSETSFFPGDVLFDGRQRWRNDDIPWVAIAIGLAAPWTKTGPKPCRGRPVGLNAELKSERQNGNSGLIQLRDTSGAKIVS